MPAPSLILVPFPFPLLELEFVAELVGAAGGVGVLSVEDGVELGPVGAVKVELEVELERVIVVELDGVIEDVEVLVLRGILVTGTSLPASVKVPFLVWQLHCVRESLSQQNSPLPQLRTPASDIVLMIPFVVPTSMHGQY